MKRGKENDKIMGPMFPRLHVNDTEKGGPRAPPRNKMALYEQLSIPSQRFNAGIMPINPNSATNLAPLASSSQCGSQERGASFPHQLPPSMQSAEKINSRYSELNTQLVQQEQKKKQEEDDFRVPIFVQSGESQNRSGNNYNRDKEGPSPFSPTYSGHVAKFQSNSKKEPKRTVATQLKTRELSRNQNEESPQEHEAGIDRLTRCESNESSRQSAKVQLRQTNKSSSFGHRTNASNNSSRLQGNENTQLDYGVDSQPDKTVWGDSASNDAGRAMGYENSSHPVRDNQQEVLISPNDPANGDAVSETSMVDSISGIDISPDDVVGIIGQKHFWKARRAIVNQQRVFAIQVFELHRLIKVQRLIAGSPSVMLDENAYLGKPVRVSSPKRLPLEYIVKSTPDISKQKDDDCEKTNDYMEFSAENAFGKASLSSVQNGSQPANCKPFPGNSPPNADPRMGSWGFNQPPGHQWLIPVMSPSEGLVYKPYPGPGFMSPVCGGCGPPASSPFMAGHNFANYGVPLPASHHHFQGPGVPHFGPPASHGYFPPYVMPLMTTSISSSAGEHSNHFDAQQYQSSCNMPSEKNGKNGTVPMSTGKFQASKDSEVQASTASSPIDRKRGRNPLPLFPTSPIAQGNPQPHDADPSPRVIRVVPHNARSATESVARIFKSIQEERKQYDSV